MILVHVYRLPKEKNEGGLLTFVSKFFRNELIEMASLTSSFNKFHCFTASGINEFQKLFTECTCISSNLYYVYLQKLYKLSISLKFDFNKNINLKLSTMFLSAPFLAIYWVSPNIRKMDLKRCKTTMSLPSILALLPAGSSKLHPLRDVPSILAQSIFTPNKLADC